MLTAFAAKVRSGEALGSAGAREALAEILSGRGGPGEIKDFLLALNERGHNAEEIAGFVEELLSRAAPAGPIARSPLVDNCGTGGDGLHTFNISTAAALVAAGAGAAMAKHGNRSVSSRSGSADVLEALGVPVDADAAATAASIARHGFGFFFAPRYHPAMKIVGPIRREMGVRTVFNLLGPLVNPARPSRQIVGVYEESLLATYAETLLRLGVERAMVVRGADGMDELTLTGPTRVFFAEKGKGVREDSLTPEDAGLDRAPISALKGGDASENARLLSGVLDGSAGPLLDATLYNAGAAIFLAGLAGSIKDGVRSARESVASGAAKGVLEALRVG